MIKSLSAELFLQAGTCLFLVYWSHSYSLVQLVYIILLVYLLNRKFVYYLTVSRFICFLTRQPFYLFITSICCLTDSSWMASKISLTNSGDMPNSAPCAPRLSRISL